MRAATERQLKVVFDVHQYRLSAAEQQELHADLDGLAEQVANFPIADLKVMLEGNTRNNDVSVKFTLILPGTTLVTNDHDPALKTAFGRCLTSLLASLEAYKGRLGNVEERQKTEKGTHQELHANVNIDQTAVAAAVNDGDYAHFRALLMPYEEGLRKRVGRWVQRYPDLEAQIGKGLEIADVVEEVYLVAFENYGGRLPNQSLGEWLEHQMEPAVRALRHQRDQELENIRLAQAAVAAEQGPGIV
jgi:hypothetical protein